MATPAIKIIPTNYQDVLALLHSDTLRTVEQAIAMQTGKRIVEDYSSASVTSMQADLSVSGMTVAQAESLLASLPEQIVRFGATFLRDEAANDDAGEFAEGEEQDPSETIVVHGLAVGFAIKYAIYYNFLANRTTPEFLAYLKNRRIPHTSRFARELRGIFDTVRA